MSRSSVPSTAFSTVMPLFGLRKPLPWILLALLIYTVAGFWLLPWIAKDQLPNIIAQDYGLPATVGEIRINPWLLTVEINDLAINDPDQQPLLGFDRLFINLQTSSIINLALTLKELSVDKPYLNALRYAFDDSNLQRALNAAPASEVAQPDTGASDPLRLLIHQINIRQGTLNIEDRLPATPFRTHLGPVDITISDLTTLPDRSGRQQVSIVTETGAKVRWNGSLEIAPLVSRGNLSISGPLLPTLYRYVEDQVTFGLTGGDVSVSLDYELVTTTDGGLSFAADGVDLALTDTQISDLASNQRLLRIPGITIGNGSIRYPENTVHFETATLNNIAINSWITPEGTLNFSKLSVPQANITTSQVESNIDSISNEAKTEAPQADTSWELALDVLQINGLNAQFEDRSLQQPASLGIDNLNFNMTNISNRENERFPFSADLVLMTGGTMTLNGAAGVLPQPVLDATLNISALKLNAAQAYLSEFAKVRINSGALNMDAALTSDKDEQLGLRGSMNIEQLSAQDLVTDNELLSWKRLLVDDIALAVSAATLEISKLRFEEPYVKLLVAKDQSTNFGDVIIDDSDIASDTASTTNDSNVPDKANEFQIQIGETDIRNGKADFADNSLPLPFAAAIRELKGDISTVSTASTEPTRVDIKGRVDEYGTATVEGELYAFDPMNYTDIAVIFDNISMPTLSPYTAEFVGRKIQNGKLNIELNYTFEESQMLGSNSVVISEFTLGDKLASENAINLPLGLAVALLKDQNGVIDINLEVSGDMEDPDFSVAGIVLKALANLITKVATSPFRALGSLVGDDDISLDTLRFAAGTPDLTPRDREKLAKLATALTERPELALVIPPTVDGQHDRLAMQQAGVAAKIEAQMSLKNQREESPDMFVSRQRKVLENLYSKAFTDTSLSELRDEYKRPMPPESRAGLDEVAYSAELRRRLVALEVVSDAQLQALAADRAQRTVDELLITAESIQQRVRTGEAATNESSDPRWIEMKMTIEVADVATPNTQTTDINN